MQFYGQFNPSVDQFIFERYFPDINISGTFIECGAFDGLTECSCKFFEESMGWTGYNFEPVPWVFTKLQENRPSSINLNYGLSSKTTAGKFNAVIHHEFGEYCTNDSLEHSDSHKAILDSIHCEYKHVEVSLLSYSDFIDKLVC